MTQDYGPATTCLARRARARFKTWTGWPAQIIQHEIDHCEGILI